MRTQQRHELVQRSSRMPDRKDHLGQRVTDSASRYRHASSRTRSPRLMIPTSRLSESTTGTRLKCWETRTARTAERCRVAYRRNFATHDVIDHCTRLCEQVVDAEQAY